MDELDVLQEIMNTPAQGDIQAVRDLLSECSRYTDGFIDEHSRYLRSHLSDYTRYKRDAEVAISWDLICSEFYDLRGYINNLIHRGLGVDDPRIPGNGDQ